MWKNFDRRENRLVLILNRSETIELIGICFENNLQQAIQEINIIKNVPIPFKKRIDNPNNPGHIEEVRFEIHKLSIDDENMLENINYPESEPVLNMYYVVVTSPGGSLDIFERWNYIYNQMIELSKNV